MPVITKAARLAPALLMLAAGCTPYRLQPEPSLVTSPQGVSVSSSVEGKDVILHVGNQSGSPLAVELDSIRLVTLPAKDSSPEVYRPIDPEPVAQVPPGQNRRFRLSFDRDIDSPSEGETYQLGLNRALALRGEGIEFEQIKLIATPATSWEPERVHVSLLGGFGYDYLYGASFLSGFGEFRLGGRKGPIEVTGRLRIQPGQTLSGIAFLHVSPALGLLFMVHKRVRVGFSLGLPPSFLWAFGYGGSLGALTYDVQAELLVDLLQRPLGALFASTRLGVTGDLLGGSHPYLIGPSLLVGLGYRLR